jgi:PAS domain S-box-containing protein
MANTIRVLLVDDESAVGDLAATCLERANDRIDVTVAASAMKGLEILSEREDVDCIVSDYNMPGEDGLEFLSSVRQNHPSIPFILFTGKGSEEIASEAISAGVTDYLQKETGTEQYAVLANRIENVVSQYRAEKEATVVTEQWRRAQEKVEALHDVATRMESCTTRPEVHDLVITAAEEILEFDTCVVDVEKDGVLYKEGVSSEITTDDVAAMSVEEGIAGRTYRTGESIIVDSNASVEDANPQGPWESAISVPLGDVGVFQAVSEQPDFFDTDDLELAELLVSHATSAYERIEREAKLRERTRELERYETVVEALGDPVCAIDAEGRHTFVNEAYESMVGYDAEELVGEHVSLVMDDADLVTAVDLIRELLRSDDRTTATFEMDILTADGDGIPTENHLGLLPLDDDGEFRGTAGVVRDITDFVRHERDLKALHTATRDLSSATTTEDVAQVTVETARDVLDLPHSAIFLWDDAEAVLREFVATDAARETFGPPTTFERGEGIIGDAFARGDVVTVGNVRTTDRGRQPAPSSIRSLCVIPLDERGVLAISAPEPDAFDEYDVDLSKILAANTVAALERVEREQRIQRSERELQRQLDKLDEFATVVSHDLRNPLNVAQGNLQLARETGRDDQFGKVEAALDRMESLVEDLLTLAREGESVGETELVPLADVSWEAWTTVDTREATLTVEPDVSAVEANPDRLRQLFENLFRNAVEHGGPTVAVRIGKLSDGGFFVADDGPGIPEEKRDRVFDSGYSTAEESTGLGLNIVENIVEAHDWAICATESEDGGSRFEVTDVESSG